MESNYKRLVVHYIIINIPVDAYVTTKDDAV